MTPDHINFRLTDEVSIGIGQDRQVMFLVGNAWHYITNTNFGRFLLETQGWGPEQPMETFQWPETGGSIQ